MRGDSSFAPCYLFLGALRVRVFRVFENRVGQLLWAHNPARQIAMCSLADYMAHHAAVKIYPVIYAPIMTANGGVLVMVCNRLVREPMSLARIRGSEEDAVNLDDFLKLTTPQGNAPSGEYPLAPWVHIYG